MSGRNFPRPVFWVISMQIFTLIPCVPFGIWAEMNTCDMRTLLRWDWQEALLHGSPRRNMPPTRGCTEKHHRGAAEADCHHSTNTMKSDPPAKVCARAMFPRVDRSWYHGCSCMWGCELRPLQLTCTRVATWSTQLSAVGGTTVASRQVLPSWCSRLDNEGSLLIHWRGAALKPPEPPSQPAAARRSIAHYVFPHYGSSVTSGVDGCLCDFRVHGTSAVKKEKKNSHGWLVQGALVLILGAAP